MWVTATGSAGAWWQQALCIRSQSSLFWCHPASLHFKFQDNNLKVVPRQNRSTSKTEIYFKTKYKMNKQEETDDRNKSEPQGELSPGTVSIPDFLYIPFSWYLQFSSVFAFSNTAVLLLVAISYPLQTAITNYPLSFISVLSYALHEAQALYMRAPCAQGARCFCHLMFVGFGVPLPPTPSKNPHGCVKIFSSSSHIQQWSIN